MSIAPENSYDGFDYYRSLLVELEPDEIAVVDYITIDGRDRDVNRFPDLELIREFPNVSDLQILDTSIPDGGIPDLSSFDFIIQLVIESNPNIRTLPGLPINLKVLDCNHNRFTSLPELPINLKELDCNRNQLTSLPELPAGLTNLTCHSNQLTSLPELPADLKILICYHNQLTSLPELPAGITTLYCFSNRLTRIPRLPDTLINFNFGLNPLQGDFLNVHNLYKTTRAKIIQDHEEGRINDTEYANLIDQNRVNFINNINKLWDMLNVEKNLTNIKAKGNVLKNVIPANVVGEIMKFNTNKPTTNRAALKKIMEIAQTMVGAPSYNPPTTTGGRRKRKTQKRRQTKRKATRRR